MRASLWREWPPLPSFQQQVPPPGVEPDSGPCVCVQFNAAWQPYILGALDQLTNARTWDTSDPDVLSTTLGQVARLRELFGMSEGCSTPPPAPPITPTDDIDCKIASYLVRTVAKEILQAAINIAFPPAEGLSIFEYLLDAIPGVGDFLGIFGLTSKSLSTTILGYVTLPWVETAAEDAVWDAIGCTVYDGVKGVHSITDGVLAVIQPAIEALDVAFPEFLSAVASIFGSLGADVLTATAELANVTDFDCSGCTDPTPVITGTEPQSYLPRRLEVRGGAVDANQVRRLTLDGGTLVVDSGTTDEVTYTPPIGSISLSVAGEPAPTNPTTGIDFTQGAGIELVTGGAGNTFGIEISAVDTSIELSDGITTIAAVKRLTFEQGTIAGTADAATYTAPADSRGVCQTGTLPEIVVLPATTLKALIAIVLAPQTYLLSANVALTNTGDGSIDVEIDLYDGSESIAVSPASLAAGETRSVAIPPYLYELPSSGAVTLRAYASDAGLQANQTATESAAPATWFTTQVVIGAPLQCYLWDLRTALAPWTLNYTSGADGHWVEGTGVVSDLDTGGGFEAQEADVVLAFPLGTPGELIVTFSASAADTHNQRYIACYNGSSLVGTLYLPEGAQAMTAVAMAPLFGPITSVWLRIIADTADAGAVVIQSLQMTGFSGSPFGASTC